MPLQSGLSGLPLLDGVRRGTRIKPVTKGKPPVTPLFPGPRRYAKKPKELYPKGKGKLLGAIGGPAPSPFQRYVESLMGGAGGGDVGTGGYPSAGGYPAPRRPIALAAPAEITWSKFDYRPKNAPSWWNAMKPSAGGPETEQIALMNMMIPFLSPQDQRAVASRLATALPKYFGEYGKAGIPSRYEPSEQQQEYMLSAQRANEAMTAAVAYSKAMGKEEMGSPYQFMQQVLGGIRAEVPTEGRMSRGQYMGLMERMAPLYGDTSMGGMAQMMAEPGYEQSILPGKKYEGKFYWGQANPLLYR